ncbi:hypothetical protein [Evansella tamaricis]|uniref:Uncharacterized protein n=1 Tax=Evansella tamaricis TaxID=2069301 RepID=A0ABS6JFA6_9BACI|nr:hypothetical protein [Evansella tamaricis]MBU9712349.1 hypothetical protein [Evansella tamaricis]
MESRLHEHLKKQSLYWLKGKVTDLCANEVKLFFHRKRVIADALGINFKRTESRIIEVKVSREDFRRDEVLHSSFGYHSIANYAYLLTPTGLLSLEEIPKGYGLLECDDFDNITVLKKATKNPDPILSFDFLIKRTAQTATNAVLFKELSKETKDQTGGSFSRGAKIQLISATCPHCKKRKKYLVTIDQEEVPCEGRGCLSLIPLNRARVHVITKYNKRFINQLKLLLRQLET